MARADGKSWLGRLSPISLACSALLTFLVGISFGCQPSDEWGYKAHYNSLTFTGTSRKQFTTLSFGSLGEHSLLPDIVFRFEDGSSVSAKEMTESDIPKGLHHSTTMELFGETYVFYELPSTLVFHNGRLCNAQIYDDVEFRLASSADFVRLPLDDAMLRRVFGNPNAYKVWSKSN